MRTHHDLDVWRDGIDLVKAIYAVPRDFPDHERFGLVVQLRRAVVSVPSNLAEGAARGSRKDFARFVSMARGSVAEVETQLIIAKELGFFCVLPELTQLIERLFSRLNRLHRVLTQDAT